MQTAPIYQPSSLSWREAPQYAKAVARTAKAGATVLVIAAMIRVASGLMRLITAWASNQTLAILSGQIEVAALELLQSRGWEIRKPSASPLLVPVGSRASRETH